MRTDRYRSHQPPTLLYALLGLSLLLNIYLVLERNDSKSSGDSQQVELQHSAVVMPGVNTARTDGLVTPKATASTRPNLAKKQVRKSAAPLPVGQKLLDAEVRHSLARTFSNAVGSDGGELAVLFDRLYQWKLNLRRDVLGGDHVKVLYEQLADGKLEIVAAVYESKKLGKSLAAYRYKRPGDLFASYWDENGVEFPQRLKESPIHQYQQVTALLGDSRNHNGVDFKAPEGTPVVSPRAGRVTRVDWNTRPNGNCVEVRFADGTYAKFLHLDKSLVRVNQYVKAGERIGLSGDTGRSTAPHLHYQLDRAKRTLDPLKVHGTYRRKLGGNVLADFRGSRDRLSSRLMSKVALAN